MYYAERLTSGNPLIQSGFDGLPDLVGIGAVSDRGLRRVAALSERSCV